MEMDRGVTVHLVSPTPATTDPRDQVVHLRAWPRIGVLAQGLRKLFDAELVRELEEPGFGGALRPVSLLSQSRSLTAHPRSLVRPAGPVSPAVRAMLELLSQDGGLR